MHWVISEGECFISNKSGINPGRNHGATDVPKKSADRQTDGFLYLPYRAGEDECQHIELYVSLCFIIDLQLKETITKAMPQSIKLGSFL